MADKQQVIDVLSKINDPELHRPLTDLDMVKSVEIVGREVNIEISLTIPGCPLKHKISEDVNTMVGALDGVEKVNIAFGVMTDEQRKNLRARLYGTDKGQTLEDGTPKVRPEDFTKRVIAVSSGKGGVGKSTTTCNLAAALSGMGYRVGILDADVYGFSVPRIMGVHGQPTIIDDHIIPMRRENIQIMSMGFFVGEDDPVIWRGPMLHKAINQFLTDVLWDNLDVLLIDMPPGTGDVTLTVAQAIPQAEMLVVTTPQPVAAHTAGRVARLAEKTNLSVLGVIENMAYYETNGHRDYIFGKDGGKNLAETLKTNFLGEIPIVTAIREASDSGEPAEFSNKNEIAGYYRVIAEALVATQT